MVQKAAWANLLQLHFSFGVTTTFFNECTRLLVFVWEALKWIWDLRHLSCQQAAQSLVNYICHSQQYTINAQPWHSKCCHLEELELKTLGNFDHWLSNHDLNLPSAYPALNFKRLVRSCRLKGNTRAGSSGAGGFIPAKEKIPPPSSSAWLSQLLTAEERDSQIFKWKETENEGDEEWGKEQRSQQSICASTASEKQQMAQKAKHCQTCCQMRRMFFMKPEPPPLLLLEDPACHI